MKAVTNIEVKARPPRITVGVPATSTALVIETVLSIKTVGVPVIET
ncbi:MAG: hypothetical protein UHI85_09045 [Turicibacter sp.]|nr:hypothetical protein [Turicibacter sp.]